MGTGHSIHFLERLERGSQVQIKRAMSLYYNSKSLEHFLSELEPPSTYKRVAISLDEHDKGPYAVLTRQGDFVTCLGEGMTTRGLYRVNFERYQILWERATQHVHQCGETESWLDERNGDWKDLFSPLLRKHQNLSKEEFVRLVSVRDVVSPWLTTIHTALYGGTGPLRKKIKKHGSRSLQRYRKTARVYWESLWATTNLSLLMTMKGSKGLGSVPKEFHQLCVDRKTGKKLSMSFEGLEHPIFWHPYQQNESGVCLRTIWTMGRLGKSLVSELKEMVFSQLPLVPWAMSVMGLVQIALRHSKQHAEVLKVLGSKKFMTAFSYQHVHHELSLEFVTYMRALLQSPSSFRDHGLYAARESLWSTLLQEDAVPPYSSSEAIPENLAMASLLHGFGGDMQDVRVLHAMTFLMPWMAEVGAEDLFLPQAILEKQPHAFNYKYVRALIQTSADYHPKPRPASKRNRVGRNDTCSCGSGKKHKKCCLKKELVDVD